MKFLSTISILCALTILIGTSCKKQIVDPVTVNQPVRKVQFVLYTDKDFSNNNSIISFKLSIQNSASLVLWDSALAPMKIKDIPNLLNKLVIERTVPNNDPSQLKVGFQYAIENVGNSWYYDSFQAGETFKTVDYDFQ